MNYNTWISSEAKLGNKHANLTRRRANDSAQETKYRCILIKDEDIVQTTNTFVGAKALVVRGKTNYANYLYVFSVLDYAFEHPDRCSCHIIYFALEESIQKVIERYMSYLLFKLDGYRIAPTDLRSTSVDYPVPDEVLDKLKSDKYQERLRFFEDCVQFETENTNPTGILRVCEDYAKKVGEYKSHKTTSRADFTKEIEVFDSYTQNDANHYKICIIDHIGLTTRRAA